MQTKNGYMYFAKFLFALICIYKIFLEQVHRPLLFDCEIMIRDAKTPPGSVLRIYPSRTDQYEPLIATCVYI